MESKVFLQKLSGHGAGVAHLPGLSFGFRSCLASNAFLQKLSGLGAEAAHLPELSSCFRSCLDSNVFLQKLSRLGAVVAHLLGLCFGFRSCLDSNVYFQKLSGLRAGVARLPGLPGLPQPVPRQSTGGPTHGGRLQVSPPFILTYFTYWHFIIFKVTEDLLLFLLTIICDFVRHFFRKFLLLVIFPLRLMPIFDYSLF